MAKPLLGTLTVPLFRQGTALAASASLSFGFHQESLSYMHDPPNVDVRCIGFNVYTIYTGITGQDPGQTQLLQQTLSAHLHMSCRK